MEPFGILSLILMTFFGLTKGAHEPPAKLLYIMLDGFRWDYVNDQPGQLPGFEKFLKEGVRPKWVDPIYPSISYPSWTTLSTGLYPESHGIVANFFYDDSAKDYFILQNATSTGKKKWWTAEPIWITATKAGKRCANFLFSQCNVPFDDVVPEFCEPFHKITGKEILRTNVDRALDKFEEGFDFIMVYTEHTDYTGHTYGPETEERKQAVRDIDETILHLLQQLEARDLDDKVNVIIVSDHGMTGTSENEVEIFEIDDYINLDYVESLTDGGAYMMIKTVPGKQQEVGESLHKMDGVSVFAKNDIPEQYHLKNSRYIHDFIIKAWKGYFVLPSASPKAVPQRYDKVSKGGHGYDPKMQDMKSIFFAKGPDFQEGLEVKPFQMVDIYQVLGHALRITVQPHNGTWSNVKEIFDGDHHHHQTDGSPMIQSNIILITSLMLLIVKMSL